MIFLIVSVLENCSSFLEPEIIDEILASGHGNSLETVQSWNFLTSKLIVIVFAGFVFSPEVAVNHLETQGALDYVLTGILDNFSDLHRKLEKKVNYFFI